MMYVRYPLSLRHVDDLLHERGIDVCDESARHWWNRFGPLFVDEVFVTIAGETHDLWRAIDHEGEVLNADVTKTRDKDAALKFFRKAMKRYGSPKVIVTDG